MSQNPPIKKIFSLFAVLILFLFVFLAVANTRILIGIAEEDGFLENLTAGILFATFCLSSYFHFKCKRTLNLFLILAIFGLVGFLDEISFGRRMFPVPMPKSHGLTIDGVHDLFHLIKNVSRTSAYHPVETSVVLSILLIIITCAWLNTKLFVKECLQS